MNSDSPAAFKLEQAQSWMLPVSALTLIAAFLGAMFDRERFFQSYLFALVYWMQIALGSLGLLMLFHLVGGAWGWVIQRSLEACALTIPLLGLFSIPILLSLTGLYPWSAEQEITQTKLHHKEMYLTVAGFIGRSAAYFAIWSVNAWLLAMWSREFDRTGDLKYTRRLRIVSGPGLVLFVLTVTFWSFDWLMSLEPDWYTTAYGFIMVSASALSAMAFAIVVLALLEQHRPFFASVVPGHFHDLGNLLLALVMFWTYCAFSQYLIYWSGNIPEEVSWYIHRSRGGWIYFAYMLIFVHFILPFLLLLSRRVKRHSGALAALAAGILIVRAVDIYWLVIPAFHPDGIAPHWLDLVMPVAVGSLWLSAFLFIMKRRPLMPLAVPGLEPQEPAPSLEAI